MIDEWIETSYKLQRNHLESIIIHESNVYIIFYSIFKRVIYFPGISVVDEFFSFFFFYFTNPNVDRMFFSFFFFFFLLNSYFKPPRYPLALFQAYRMDIFKVYFTYLE